MQKRSPASSAFILDAQGYSKIYKREISGFDFCEARPNELVRFTDLLILAVPC
jgi:hypothetical protein